MDKIIFKIEKEDGYWIVKDIETNIGKVNFELEAVIPEDTVKEVVTTIVSRIVQIDMKARGYAKDRVKNGLLQALTNPRIDMYEGDEKGTFTIMYDHKRNNVDWIAIDFENYDTPCGIALNEYTP